jgi:hypothetical protein
MIARWIGKLASSLGGVSSAERGMPGASQEKLQDLRRRVDGAIERLQSGNSMPEDFCSASEVRMDGDAAWVAGMIKRSEMHENDFAVFGKFQPFLMLEGGNRVAAVETTLSEAGCIVAEFDGKSLRSSEGISQDLSGFFDHTSRLAEHRDAGILG